ncbi:putative aldo/keto reductase-like oxidoreductase [Halanaerobium saccharolyticum]|uniref:Putative aldo/keto reductase-like oxidoreductase n=1 Tax=Halanaerobium saccharolyticum TaxID=43595 RepID=A0A4R6LTM8_9FIRM|nr:aldo/keto reductase [Halanaerobium saccharolyticum]TDO91296.1 putative aldo/keto reductase-like oxidoreductase [Halanaerobium saccharolyticum]
MKKRSLGNTGLEISLLGFGGFHLIEIPADRAADLLNTYLDHGGNYLETAASYGDGESEKKIGEIVKKRRDEIILASKTGVRDAGGAMEEIDRSLKNLQTDHLDIIFMHGVGDKADLESILAPGGSLEAAKKAKEMGKVKHIGITGHGQPDVLIEALKTGEFEVMMTHFNYFDNFNFPRLEKKLLPLVRERNIGTLCMKPLADGFLWQNVEDAFRYVFSLPIDAVVTGMNSREMLEMDLNLAAEFEPMTAEEKEELFKNAEELGDYICRQCADCSVSRKFGENIKGVFRMEGYYDRQMYDGRPRNPADYALRDRLRFWFGDKKLAEERYQKLEIKAADLLKKAAEFKACKYGLDVKNKLEIVDYKLGESEIMQ